MDTIETARSLDGGGPRCRSEWPTPGTVAEDPRQQDGGATLDEVLDERNLLDAWERVRANRGAPGCDGEEVEQFAQGLLGRLHTLQAEVADGRYVARPLRVVALPKPDGGQRLLAIPGVRDRVLQAAIAHALGRRIEPTLDEASHAYRPGRSVLGALAALLALRDQGRTTVLKADVASFFDHIHQPTLMAQLRRFSADPGLLALVGQVLAAVLDEDGERRLMTRGVPQGSPLSPLLANLYLHPFDVGMRAQGFQLVRYADDLVLACRDADEAARARDAAQRTLRELHLELNPAKTRIASFVSGFDFLGVRFKDGALHALTAGMAALLPRLGNGEFARAGAPDGALDEADETVGEQGEAELPLASGVLVDETPAGQRSAPLLQSVYVGEPGSVLRLDGERLLVSRGQDLLASVPLGQVDQLAVSANVLVSSALLRHCAHRRINVHLSDPGGGEAVASLDRGGWPEMALLDAQRRACGNPAVGLPIARALLEGKLHNAKTVLRRFGRREAPEVLAVVDEAVAAADHAIARLALCANAAALRGHEGTAARAYFHALAALLPPALGFSGRRRRPPPDPVNVLLSFGYSVLHANMASLLRLAGLNAHLGVLHAAAPGTLALASDLIEEFRAPVVDAVVLTVLREGQIGIGDFDFDDASETPCRLRREGRQRFVRALECKLESRFVHPRLKVPTDMRRAMQQQVRELVLVMQGRVPRYLPLKFR